MRLQGKIWLDFEVIERESGQPLSHTQEAVTRVRPEGNCARGKCSRAAEQNDPYIYTYN